MKIPKHEVTAYKIVDSLLKTSLRLAPYSSFTEQIALMWGYRYQPPPTVVKLRSGSLLKTTKVDHLQLLLYYLGTFEPRALRAMSDDLQQGSTLLDVGANIGLFTIEGARRVGPTGKVISIEALPEHAGIIKAAASLNNVDWVEVHAVAVGDKEGAATLTRPRGANFGMFTLGNVDGDESVSVPVQRIDDIVRGQKVDFVKMDIEGSEYKALLGAQETLKHKPKILIELNGPALRACGSSAVELKRLLADYGYNGSVVGSGKKILVDEDHDCDECIFSAT